MGGASIAYLTQLPCDILAIECSGLEIYNWKSCKTNCKGASCCIALHCELLAKIKYLQFTFVNIGVMIEVTSLRKPRKTSQCTEEFTYNDFGYNNSPPKIAWSNYF